MRRYYFDTRDYRGLSTDEEGVECPDLEAVQDEAVRALAEMSKDTVRSATLDPAHEMSIEVRDDAGPVMQVRSRFDVIRYS
jgi:hypothetical protein